MEIGVRLIGLLLRFLDWLFTPLYWLINRGKCFDLPPINNPILLFSAEELARKIRNRELTSHEVVTAYIDRVNQVNPYINAVSEDRFTDAIKDAINVDKYIAECYEHGTSGTLKEKPLLGVPVTIKESCSLAGMSNSVGCIENASSKATSDGGAVTLMKQAGAIPILVSNTPELCLGWETTNLIRGTTNNPYKGSRSAGGSSGGEAALVCAGASCVGAASDLAGSTRLPAAYCGLYGHKPTPGIVPISGHIPNFPDPDFPKYLCIGPLVRKATDLKYTLNVLAGENKGKLSLDEPVDVNKLRIHYMTEATKSWALMPTDPEIKDAIIKSAKYLTEKCGAELSEKKFEEFDDAVEISISVFFSMENIPDMLQRPNDKHERNLFIEALKCIFGWGTRSLQCIGFSFIQKTKLFIPERRKQYYHNKAKLLQEEIISTLSTTGVLLTPAFSTVSHPHNAVWTRASGVLYTMIHNVLQLPATVVPISKTKDGLPVAIQVIAAPYQDRLCLAVAEKLEEAFGGWQPPH